MSENNHEEGIRETNNYKDPYNIEVAATTPIDFGWSVLRTKNEFMNWAKCHEEDLPNTVEYQIADNMLHVIGRWEKYRKGVMTDGMAGGAGCILVNTHRNRVSKFTG